MKRPGHADALAQAAVGTALGCDHDWTTDPNGDGENCSHCRARRFTVRLAQAPADALEVLVDRGGFHTADQVAEAAGHPGRRLQARNALALLRDLGLVTQVFDEHSVALWSATDDGHDTITRARQEATDA